MKQYDITVVALPDDPRLDKVIPHYNKEISRSAARKLIENGSVYLNRKRCQQNAKEIRPGDQIRFFLAEQNNEAEANDESDALPITSSHLRRRRHYCRQ